MNTANLFREVTRRICGSLDFEEALHEVFLYLKDLFPLQGIFITRYDYEYKTASLFALAYDKAGVLIDEELPLSETAWDSIRTWLIESRNGTIPWIRDQDHPINREIVKLLKGNILAERKEDMKSFCSLTCALKLKKTIIGNLTFSASGKNHYNDTHVDIIREINEPFAIAVSNALRYMELLQNHKALQKDALKIRGDVMIGSDGGLFEVMQLIKKVAPTDSHVFLLGETGTGKEVVANQIHGLSSRADNPFIRVNCGAVPESLIDSELFGHEKGAFTGAVKTVHGRFERADGGTLFLDEIAELPLSAQVKLLRVIQTGEFERVGGAKILKTDVRIIAATHRDLNTMILNEQFRTDLWYRLNVFPVQIPPLRDRKEDIPKLVSYLLEEKSKEMNIVTPPEPNENDLLPLINYNWPGNVRELQNLIERALILSKGNRLEFPTLSPINEAVSHESSVITKTFQSLDDLTKAHIINILKSVKGKISGPNGAAELLGINPNTLRSKMQKLKIPYAIGKL